MKKIGRKIYHLCGGLGLLALYVKLGPEVGLLALLGITVFATSLDLARLAVPAVNAFFYKYFPKFIRDNERDRLTGSPWYLLGVTCALAFFSLPVAVYAVCFLACGDVAATTVGERWGRTRLSGGKSIEGTAAFFAAAFAAGLVIDAFFYPMSPAIFIAGAAVAAIVEIQPLRLNDNLTIPLVAGAVMQFLVLAGL
ncbi:MAG TPA: phosphatidate cytidylyltransferase [Nitrospirota bacterium]|nr:phosphatidate cytidylyltransferase [Nitrospirota bacterium]